MSRPAFADWLDHTNTVTQTLLSAGQILGLRRRGEVPARPPVAAPNPCPRDALAGLVKATPASRYPGGSAHRRVSLRKPAKPRAPEPALGKDQARRHSCAPVP